MSDTNKLTDELQRMRNDLVNFALFCLSFPLAFAQGIMDYAKLEAAKILQAVVVEPLNFLIWQISKLQLLLFKIKVSMDRQLTKTMHDICEAHSNLVLFSFEFPDPWLFCILGFKSQMITVFLVFHGLVSALIQYFYFALRRVSCFIYRSTTNEISTEIKGSKTFVKPGKKSE